MTLWYVLAQPQVLGLDKWAWTTTRQPSFDRAAVDWRTAFCICEEDVFPLMYWSSDGVITLALPDRALDTTDPVSLKRFRVPCTALSEIFKPAVVWRYERPSLLWITIDFLNEYFEVYLTVYKIFNVVSDFWIPLYMWATSSSVSSTVCLKVHFVGTVIFEIRSKLVKYWHFGMVAVPTHNPKEFRLRLKNRLSYTVDL